MSHLEGVGFWLAVTFILACVCILMDSWFSGDEQ